MSVLTSTILAASLAILATIAWIIAAYLQKRWRLFCVVVAALCAYFAAIYLLILVGSVDSTAAGQLYLRPATGAMMIALIALAVSFWRRR